MMCIYTRRFCAKRIKVNFGAFILSISIIISSMILVEDWPCSFLIDKYFGLTYYLCILYFTLEIIKPMRKNNYLLYFIF